MITNLTDEQIARFPEFVKKWTDIGLCTDPADRPRAEVGVRLAYEIAGLPHPKHIVWCDSPLSMGLTRAIVMGLGSIDVGDQKKVSVGASVGASVWDSVRDSVWDSVRDSVWDSAYGQHDSGWLSFYEYFALACSLSIETQNLSGLFEVAKSANWWLPHENICWISERHHVLDRNDRGQLHCDVGPALSYPDGWSIWSIDGVRVDEQIVMRPETQTIDQLKSEENEEVRRIRIERFGWLRYLQESGAKIYDSRRNERDAQNEDLYLLSDGTRRFVCVDPSTGRKYALGVPESVETCEQAQWWVSHGLDKFAIHRS